MTDREKAVKCMSEIIDRIFRIDNKPITATLTVDEWATIYASLKLTIGEMPGTKTARVCERIREKMETFTIDK